jgi:hypothetical protein
MKILVGNLKQTDTNKILKTTKINGPGMWKD